MQVLTKKHNHHSKSGDIFGISDWHIGGIPVPAVGWGVTCAPRVLAQLGDSAEWLSPFGEVSLLSGPINIH